jgi:hypothetical protein
MSVAGVGPEAAATAPPAASTQHVDTLPSVPATADADAMDITPSIENGANVEILQSQPMTATTSSASQNPMQLEGDGSAEAATYGTRSRNKGGNSRPNYADDRELDLEIEAAGRIPKTKPKKVAAPSSNASVAQDESSKSAAPPQNGFATVNTAATNGVAPLPGMSTFSTQPPSKKRKQPGSNTSVSSPAPAPVQAAQKTRGAPSSASRLHLETNMLSFSRCRGRLNAKKQLIADDGTTLSANGEEPIMSPTVNVLISTRRSRLFRLRTSWRTILSRSNYGVPACDIRARFSHRCSPSQLVLSTERHPTAGSGHSSCVCIYALRHMPVDFTAREVQYSTSIRNT